MFCFIQFYDSTKIVLAEYHTYICPPVTVIYDVNDRMEVDFADKQTLTDWYMWRACGAISIAICVALSCKRTPNLERKFIVLNATHRTTNDKHSLIGVRLRTPILARMNHSIWELSRPGL
jgi:hypothetical protein